MTLAPPEPGQLVLLRDRHCVVTNVEPSTLPVSNATAGLQHLVTASSVEDDAGFGEELRVIWELEAGAALLPTATLPTPNPDRLDDPERLDAFIDAIRWGAVASADARSLQAPFRSGIAISDYQLDPVIAFIDPDGVPIVVFDQLVSIKGHSSDPAVFEAAVCAALSP